MGTLYKIAFWSENFENNRTKELKHLAWVPIPNKHDGDGYTELLDHPNGAAHFGAWMAIVQVASKCDTRGTLLREGARPHDSASLSRITRIPKGVFDEAIPRLCAIGWLTSEVVVSATDTTIPQAGAGKSQDGAALEEWNGTEQKEQQGAACAAGSKEFSAEFFGPVEKRTRKPMPEIPKSLRTPGFLAAWEKWVQHKGRKHTPLSAEQNLKKCAEWGVMRAIAAIEHSIGGSYAGLYEPGGQKVKHISADRADAQQRREKEAQAASLREREIAEDEARRRAEVITGLAPDLREQLRQACIADANEFVRPKLEQDDPVTGKMLPILIYTRLKASKMAEVA